MKTKTKKQAKPEPIGRVEVLIRFEGDPESLDYRKERCLVIPMHDRARVVDEMAVALAEEESKSFKRLSQGWQATFRRLASASLTRLGWPEGGES